MKNRLLFGTVFIALLLGLVYLDAWWSTSDLVDDPPYLATKIGIVSQQGLPMVPVLFVLVAFATGEMVRLLTAAGHAPLPRWPEWVNLILIWIPFIAANRQLDPVLGRAFDDRWTLTVLLIGFLGTCIGVARRKRTEGAMGAIASTLLVIAYIGLLAQFILRIRVYGPAGASWLLLYFIGTVKACDIGAYFTGRMIGRTKLIEWLSPKKTIEGLAGGVAFSILVAVGVPMIVRSLAEPGSQTAAMFPSPAMGVVFGIAMALVGHAGDLLESLFKRDAKAKDSAAAIPAFGGVLDIIDSPLLAAPLAYWLLLR